MPVRRPFVRSDGDGTGDRPFAARDPDPNGGRLATEPVQVTQTAGGDPHPDQGVRTQLPFGCLHCFSQVEVCFFVRPDT